MTLNRTQKIAYTAMGTALMVVCSWLYIPLPVPVTLQSFAMCLLSAVLGMGPGLMIWVCYVALGIVGLPVFSGFMGGVGALMGATGGYILGFVFIPLCVGAGTGLRGKASLAASMALGIILCYICGTLWYTLVYAESESFAAALTVCVLPYVPPDGLKVLLAAYLSQRLKNIITRLNTF